MRVTVDVSRQDGPSLAQAPRAAAAPTATEDAARAAADALVRRVIAENIGKR
jgi:hypothetical protein